MDTVRVNKQVGLATEWPESGTAAVGFVAGLLLTVAGFAYKADYLAAIGFLPLVMSFMYLNGMFWSWVYKDRDPSQFTHNRDWYV